MKTLITILLILLVVACKAQDTLYYYTKIHVDTSYYPIEYCDSVFEAYEQQIDDILDISQNPEIYGDTEITIHDSLGDEVLFRKVDQNYWYTIDKGNKMYQHGF